jgi:hypothetical protein
MSNLETEMMLKTKVAVIYGAGGGIAGARGKNTHLYINISTGNKVSSGAGTMACMI